MEVELYRNEYEKVIEKAKKYMIEVELLRSLTITRYLVENKQGG